MSTFIQRRPQVGRCLAFFAAYVASCAVAWWLAIVPGTGISLWIPGGLYLAVLLKARTVHWPVYMLAAAGAELLANHLWFRNPIGVALALHAGNAAAAGLGAVMIRRWATRASFRLDGLRDVLVLLFVGAAIAPIASAVIGAATLHYAQGQPLGRAFLLWWSGDATGAMIGAPLVLIAGQALRHPRWPPRSRWGEVAALACALLLVATLALSGRLPLAYVVTPVLLWASMSFQFAGAAVSILTLTLMSTYFTVAGLSPFSAQASTEAWQAVMLQLFLAVSSALTLSVAALSRQHSQALARLRVANANLEARVRRRTEQLEEAARHKDVFLALVAHELRSPLSAITMATHLMGRTDVCHEHVRKAVEVIHRQSGLLSRLVDDLMDAAQIAEGKLALQIEDVDLAEVVELAIESSRSAMEGRQHALAVVLPAQPFHVRADRGRLVQCVGNLLSNAAKYTSAGGRIELAVRETRDLSDISGVVIEVSDNGIGMTPEACGLVFDLFYQVRSPDGSTGGPDHQRGLGLGLSLVKRLVALHGGTVGVRSAGPGQGSSFWIQLPGPVTSAAA
ncbi:MASE1 domain-containing protein [Ideonella sp. DXS29W]|uniref:histidine kinase n=1 Tax=Ideonella lacteola TaxID=2984193 RepID=A0ABU9BV53_9BURK